MATAPPRRSARPRPGGRIGSPRPDFMFRGGAAADRHDHQAASSMRSARTSAAPAPGAAARVPGRRGQELRSARTYFGRAPPAGGAFAVLHAMDRGELPHGTLRQSLASRGQPTRSPELTDPTRAPAAPAHAGSDPDVPPGHRRLFPPALSPDVGGPHVLIDCGILLGHGRGQDGRMEIVAARHRSRRPTAQLDVDGRAPTSTGTTCPASLHAPATIRRHDGRRSLDGLDRGPGRPRGLGRVDQRRGPGRAALAMARSRPRPTGLSAAAGAAAGITAFGVPEFPGAAGRRRRQVRTPMR